MAGKRRWPRPCEHGRANALMRGNDQVDVENPGLSPGRVHPPPASGSAPSWRAAWPCARGAIAQSAGLDDPGGMRADTVAAR